MPDAVETGFRPPRRTPLASFSPQRESRAHTMRQHGHGHAEHRSRHSRRNGNPEPTQCANTVMAVPNPALAILAAAGIQSPYSAPTGSWPSRTPLASLSPQANPEPMQCANTVMAAPNPAPVILAAAGIQSPCNAPTRSWPRRTPLPSFSPQRESRALTMRQHGHGRTEPRSRHCRRSGNPEPMQCANTVMAAPNPALAIVAAAGIQSPYNAPAWSWPRRTSLSPMPAQWVYCRPGDRDDGFKLLASGR